MASKRNLSPKNLTAIAGTLCVLAGIVFVGWQIYDPWPFVNVIKQFDAYGIHVHTNWPGFALAAIGAILLLASLDWRKS
jgi:hypothetical protein